MRGESHTTVPKSLGQGVTHLRPLARSLVQTGANFRLLQRLDHQWTINDEMCCAAAAAVKKTTVFFSGLAAANSRTAGCLHQAMVTQGNVRKAPGQLGQNPVEGRIAHEQVLLVQAIGDAATVA